ncbi:O-antigen ligase family protein [Vibrio gallicus]|uniref:O-antigen ligase family protein n=1 Tax=Vibrio gallicus TaxID=190897 RepID=UPI0021C29D8E|nr:O-antigen ligase family protein [Vibrio gallicus]
MLNLAVFSSFFSFIIPALILVYGKSYSYTIIPFMVVGLICCYWCDKNKFDKDAKLIAISFFGYFACTLISLILLGGSFGNLDAPSRAILILPALLLVLAAKPNPKALIWGIVIGSALVGLIALYHHLVLHVRPLSVWQFMVIQAGDIAMSMGLFAVVVAFHLKRSHAHFLVTTLAFIGGGLGMLASLLSGARGGWVLSPFILLFILWCYRKEIGIKAKIISILGLVIVGYFSYPMVEKRVDIAVKEVSSYITSNTSYTSVGTRFDLWKSGAYAFIKNPIFGTGYEQREQTKLNAIQDGWATKAILKHSRLHNSYIEEASVKGTIGIIVLLFFFGAPLWVFGKGYLANQNIYALLGVVHIISTMGYCLTQNFINHHSGMLFYIAFIVLFYAYSKHYSEDRV